ncbi:alkylation response protein AidB-like acyl-CoA dehydrogenase [Nocardioides luteus]|uniref:Acyl-CoA dehydrogenase n=1 Tax=Nocardioides luteus TaxID=1844 RepID=A0ABQ5SZT8_9ACTN|nr:acyl-CoA dehydrogenase [Nocardioides luteus]MDR7310716.1 alkylation response protein AidB-like acyl-CoA dehydrogenase [Nocardioides luteus]GGR41083.1 acyl-CoA dehydrogenase [Nocardioides luteus]GLJ69504.1 acyl-CoA dehydrogenase [Nocardioides luteus]
MPIGITDEHQALSESLRDWAKGLGGIALARAAEGDASAAFEEVWRGVEEYGVAAIAAPEPAGGGGTLLDAAVALEACAHELLPGPLLGSAVAAYHAGASGLGDLVETIAAGGCGIGLDPVLEVGDRLRGTVRVAYDGGGAAQLLLGARGAEGEERWFLLAAEHADVRPQAGPDLTRRVAEVQVDVDAGTAVEVPGLSGTAVRRTALTLAAAEASGIAQWCLTTAVEYAKVREQFGAPIGSFQAIKHLCAQMLETAEAVAATAWDAASAAADDSDQWSFAAEVAGATALDGAVRAAQDCIQVLGGIGFTFEHDAHLYLRRAVALRSLLDSGDAHAAALSRLAVDGVRRSVRVGLDGKDEEVRPRVREAVAAVAARPEPERRDALVDTALLAPHWPAPYGLGAGPVEQLVIDEELAAAGITRPDIKIAGWAVPTILKHGTDAQRERFVEPSLRGEIVWCQLFSEPGAGSDLASLATRAERVDGGWRLTGQKVWTSLAAEADWAICLARTNPDVAKHKGISYFLVDMRSEGIDVRPLRELTGDALFNEVFLDGVFVPDELVVGEVDGGWRLARTTLANERVAMASTNLGGSVERAVSLVGGRSEADLARVGHAVALSTVCSLLGVRSTLKALAGRGPGAESSVAKLLTVRNRQDASELVVDLLGALALTDDPQVREDLHESQLTRCLSIAGGTTQVLRNVAAERILGLPR